MFSLCFQENSEVHLSYDPTIFSSEFLLLRSEAKIKKCNAPIFWFVMVEHGKASKKYKKVKQKMPFPGICFLLYVSLINMKGLLYISISMLEETVNLFN